MSSSYPPPPGEPGGQHGQGQYGAQPGQYEGQPGQYGGQPGQYGGQPGQYGAQPAQYGGGSAAPKNGLGIAALVLGILGLLGAWVPLIGLVGGFLGLLAVILGIIGRNRAKKGQATNGGMALVGIITGALALILSIAVSVYAVQQFNQQGGPEFLQCLADAGNDVAAQQACQDAIEQ
ncbi:uncharacterized protein DUF4190 [Kineococcus xinjiangensis]|uniref:Uncharacterized protein DUF4190 n=1 Tax=Kineococcus xinjiangensis TaxID=512762 RepID=A0A2S6II66_9ACTN|nr:DUF4190 domain-containing protein [Kineococcus xinjiangensis]PPK93909.1 uncharacterized protein DUF4190 [Kineococcus xinjiangensis]